MYQETSLTDYATLAQCNIKDGDELHMVKSHIAMLIEDSHGEVWQTFLNEVLLGTGENSL